MIILRGTVSGEISEYQYYLKLENLQTCIFTTSNGGNVSRDGYLHFLIHFMTLSVHLLFVRQESVFCQNHVSVQSQKPSGTSFFQ